MMIQKLSAPHSLSVSRFVEELNTFSRVFSALFLLPLGQLREPGDSDRFTVDGLRLGCSQCGSNITFHPCLENAAFPPFFRRVGMLWLSMSRDRLALRVFFSGRAYLVVRTPPREAFTKLNGDTHRRGIVGSRRLVDDAEEDIVFVCASRHRSCFDFRLSPTSRQNFRPLL